MSDRLASIGFDDFRTEVAPLIHAELEQGLPLSPILFIFFTPTWSTNRLPFKVVHDASSFIDDYFRWLVSHSAEENLAKIQSEDTPVSRPGPGAADRVLLYSRKDRAHSPYQEKRRAITGLSDYEREYNRTIS
jgi:hypothetical protein